MVVAHAARLAQEAEGASEESGESAAKIVSDVRFRPILICIKECREKLLSISNTRGWW
jgi:hypothetical protein